MAGGRVHHVRVAVGRRRSMPAVAAEREHNGTVRIAGCRLPILCDRPPEKAPRGAEQRS